MSNFAPNILNSQIIIWKLLRLVLAPRQLRSNENSVPMALQSCVKVVDLHLPGKIVSHIGTFTHGQYKGGYLTLPKYVSDY